MTRTVGSRRREQRLPVVPARAAGTPGRRVISALAGAATIALAVVGVVVLGWMAFAAFTGAQLIVFKTGSMSPTMPTGAAAVVVPVAATDLRVGDVVTVQSHGGDLPVTHRVVGIEPSDVAVGAMQLTLRGDANDEDDSAPYIVTEAHRVVFSMAGLGTAIAFAQTPISMGVLTIVAAMLVVRAFWPRRTSRRDDAFEHDALDDEPPEQPSPTRLPTSGVKT